MTYNLFIDDERDPINVIWGPYQSEYRYETWLIVRSADEAYQLIDMFGWPNKISFDHDLGENQPTGYDIIKKLTHKLLDSGDCSKLFTIRVHSRNPVGAKNIASYWDNFVRIVSK